MTKIKFKVFCVVLVLCTLLIFLQFRSWNNVKECRNRSPDDRSPTDRRTNGGPGSSGSPWTNGRPVAFSKGDSVDNPYKNTKDWKTFMKALKKYKVFHKKKLEEFKSGNRIRTLTWACSHDRCFGLGDQLLRMQYFLLLAMMSDRLFTLYWDERLKKTTKYLLPREIDWSYFNTSSGMCEDKGVCSHHVYDTTSFWAFGWTKQEFSYFGEVLFSSIQHITVSGQVVVHNMFIGNRSMMDPGDRISDGMGRLGVKGVLLSGNRNDTVYCGHSPLWYTMLHRLGVHKVMDIQKTTSGQIHASDPWVHVGHAIFTYLFQFHEDLLEKAVEYQKSLGLYKKDYLSLHLRTGFVGTPNQEAWMIRYLHCGWKFYCGDRQIDCIVKHSISLVDQTLGKGFPIYLSTDSDPIKKRIRDSYSNRNIIFGNLTLMHSQKVQRSCEAKNDVDGHLSMWLDYIMLANGRMIVHPDSSFSVNAAFMRPIPHANHSWVLYDRKLNCLASYRAGNVTCIC